MAPSSDIDQRMFAALVARELTSRSLTAGAGDSWRWQLRDKDGQWIEMGSKVSWLADGILHTGFISGSSNPSFAYVVDDKNKRERSISTRSLTALDPMPKPAGADDYVETDYDKYGDPSLGNWPVTPPVPVPVPRRATDALRSMGKRIQKAHAGSLITAYPDAERTPDGRVILTDAQMADFKPKTGPHSMLAYVEDVTLPDGRVVKALSKEREVLHDRLVRQALAGVRPTGRQRIFTYIGGGPGSGKSTVTKILPDFPKTREFKDSGVMPPGNAVLVDGDAIKLALPEWKRLNREDKEHAASITHEESSIIAKATADAAVARDLDVVLDGTGDGDPTKMLKKIKKYQGEGYKVHGLYVTVPASEALVRSLERSIESGRYMPIQPLMDIHRDVVHTTDGVIDKYDDFDLWDTDIPWTVPPTMPHKIVVDNKVVDQARYDAYRAKTNVTDLQAAREALDKAEAKKYREIKDAETGLIWSPEQVKEFTISTIKDLIVSYENRERDLAAGV